MLLGPVARWLEEVRFLIPICNYTPVAVWRRDLEIPKDRIGDDPGELFETVMTWSARTDD
jgi:hypothetical protein